MLVLEQDRRAALVFRICTAGVTRPSSRCGGWASRSRQIHGSPLAPLATSSRPNTWAR
ncbi:MAG: hypothetical protein ACRDTG_06780 [Pseudonocardiaceae bacterium]